MKNRLMNSKSKNWIEVNIDVLIDDRYFLIDLYDNIIKCNQDFIESWHFFREPYIRFRVECKDENSKELMKSKLQEYLKKAREMKSVKNWYYGNHGRPNKDYIGEHEFYGLEGFEIHKKIWEYQSELAVLRYRQEKEGRIEMSREGDIDRLWHLVANQLYPVNVVEVAYEIDGGKVFRQSTLIRKKEWK
jgi:hypothetical protein